MSIYRTKRSVLPKRKLYNKSKLKKVLFISFLFLVVVFSASFSLVQVSRFENLYISNINFSGNVNVSNQELMFFFKEEIGRKKMGVLSGLNTFLFRKSKVEERILENLKYVKEVNIETISLRELDISIIERQPAFLWCLDNNSQCFLVDALGLIYAPSDNDEYFIYYGNLELGDTADPIGEYVMETESFKRLNSFILSLSDLSISPKNLNIDEHRDVYLFIHLVGVSSEELDSLIKFNSDNDFLSVFSNISAIFGDPQFKREIESGFLEYIDLRFGNKIFYKIGQN
jgi:cell division septal protein FtsQ